MENLKCGANMLFSVEVDNIKCGGCAHSIESKLSEMDGISQVTVEVEAGLVTFESEDDTPVEAVKGKLSSMGYPEKGSMEGVGAMGAKAKSYVSCAIGKMSQA
jgi:copper chaperone